jgi:6-phosphogluconolactonase
MSVDEPVSGGPGFRCGVFPDHESMCRAVAERLVRTAGERESLAIALAGGTTPLPLYRMLANEFRSEIAWERVHVFWSDERLVPLADTDSNYRAAKEALLDHVPLPTANIHPAPVEIEDPDEAARAYEQTLDETLGRSDGRLDWALLGLGEDGHMASLFPGHEALHEDERWVIAVTDSPKPPPVRLTMTLAMLRHSREVHILAAGASKLEAVRRTLVEPSDGPELPARGLVGGEATVIVWADEAAAGLLPSTN